MNSSRTSVPTKIKIRHPKNRFARLSRAGFLFGRRQLDGLRADEPLMEPTGVLQIAGDQPAEEQWPQRLQRQGWPAGLVRWCGASEAGEAVGLRPRRGGLWFADGAVVSAAAWCRAMLAQAVRNTAGMTA